MLVLIIGIVIFLGIHSVRIVAPDWRKAQIAAKGLGAWKGLYSIISAIGLALIVWGYALARPEAGFIYEPPKWAKHITLTLMLFSMIFLAISQLPAGRIKPFVKHPFLLATKLWAFGHFIANGDTASLVLFLSFLAWAIFDRISESRRERAGETAKIVAGPIANDLIAIAIGVAVYALIVWKLHEWLIGVSPI